MTGRIAEEDVGKLFVFSRYGKDPGLFMSYARVLAENSPSQRLSFVGPVGTDPDHKDEAIPRKWTYGTVFRAESEEEVLMKAYAMGVGSRGNRHRIPQTSPGLQFSALRAFQKSRPFQLSSPGPRPPGAVFDGF